MATIGKLVNAAGAGAQWTTIDSATGNQRAVITASLPVAGFLYRIGAYLKKTGGQDSLPRVKFGVWANNDGQPGALLARTGWVNVGPEGNYEANLAWSSSDAGAGITAGGLRLPLGTRVFVGLIVGTQQARNTAFVQVLSPRSNEQARLYKRTITEGDPTSPFGSNATSDIITTPALYAFTNDNTAPTATPTGPANNSTTSATQPTFTGTFADADFATSSRDRISAYQIEVRQVGQEALTWTGTWPASTGERAANTFSRTMDTVSLIRTRSYQWRVRAADDLGAWGAYSAWLQFAVAAGGSVDSTNAAPNGRQNTGVVTVYGGRWSHPNGLAMNQAKVKVWPVSSPADYRITETAITSFVTSGAVSQVPDGSLFTLSTGSQLTTSANPLPGGEYQFEIIGRDTSGGWSTSTVPGSFRVNYPPTTPVLVAPAPDEVTPTRPTLYWTLDDRDQEDTVGANVYAQVELTRVGGSTQTISPIYTVENAETGIMYLVPTPQQIPAPTGTEVTYTWRVRGYDGYLWGAWSAARNFTFSPNPRAQIVTPDTGNPALPSVTPVISWKVLDGQMAKARVYLYTPNAVSPFFGSPEQTYERGSNQAYPTDGVYSIPPGWLRNNSSYEVAVQITTPGNVSGTSPRQPFRVSFAGIDPPGGLFVSTTKYDRDQEACSVSLDWSRSEYNPDRFAGYVIRRRLTSDDPDRAVAVAYIRNISQTSWTDHHAPGNEGLIYSLSQVVINNNNNRQETGATEVTIAIPMTVPTLVSVRRPRDRRAAVMYLATGLSGGYRRTEATYVTWGSNGTPIVIGAPYGYGQSTVSLSITLRTDERGTLQEHFADFLALAQAGDILCLREEYSRLFCRIAQFSWSRGDVPGTRTIDLTLEEVSYDETKDVIVD